MTIFSLALIVAIAISVFLLFEILYNLHRQKRMERLQAALDKAAKDHGLIISKQQLLGDRIIGLDEANDKMLFVQIAGKKEDLYVIDLEDVQSCSLETGHIPFWNGSEKMGVLVQAITLQFHFKNGDVPLVLPFYRNTTDQVFEIREREKQAKEWRKLLSARLKEKSPGERLLVA